MIGYQVEIVNLPQVDAKFAALDREIGTLKPLWERYESQFHAEEGELFIRAPWTPLSEAYAERKRQEVGNKPVLQYTGTLMKSLTEPKAEGAISRINDLAAEFGSSIPYGIFHQLGTARMPARSPLAEPYVPVYELIAGQNLDSAIKRSGFN